MDDLDLAQTLFKNKSSSTDTSSSQGTVQGSANRTYNITAEAIQGSENGVAIVMIGNQPCEIPTTFQVNAGDLCIVSVANRSPVITGIIGRGDEVKGEVDNAQETADAKNRIFYDEPYPPYDEGDIWCWQERGGILICRHSREADELFNEDDWEVAFVGIYSQDLMTYVMIGENVIDLECADEKGSVNIFPKLNVNGKIYAHEAEIEGALKAEGSLTLNGSFTTSQNITISKTDPYINLQSEQGGGDVLGLHYFGSATGKNTFGIYDKKNTKHLITIAQDGGAISTIGNITVSKTDASIALIGDDGNMFRMHNYNSNGISYFAVYDGKNSNNPLTIRNSDGFVACTKGLIVNGKTLLDRTYPVGALYISYVSTSPADLFGGTWTPITGYFLRAGNNTGTGGSNVITRRGSSGWGVTTVTTANVGWGGRPVLANWNTPTDENTYDEDNMPVYQNVYVWRRTA